MKKGRSNSGIVFLLLQMPIECFVLSAFLPKFARNKPHTNMADVYYINRNGKKEGPYTLEELGANGIEPTTRVFKEGLARFFDAEEIQEIKERYFSGSVAREPEVRVKPVVPDVDLQKSSLSDAARRERERRERENQTRRSVRQETAATEVEQPSVSAWGGSGGFGFGQPSVAPDEPKEWYVNASDGNHKGPYTMSELKSMGLRTDTQVWRQGTDAWVFAMNVPELSPFLIHVCPPYEGGSTTGSDTSMDSGSGYGNIYGEEPVVTPTSSEKRGYGHPFFAAVPALLLAVVYTSFLLVIAQSWFEDYYIFGRAMYSSVRSVFALISSAPSLILAVCGLVQAFKARKYYFGDDWAAAQKRSGAATAYGLSSIFTSVVLGLMYLWLFVQVGVI